MKVESITDEMTLICKVIIIKVLLFSDDFPSSSLLNKKQTNWWLLVSHRLINTISASTEISAIPIKCALLLKNNLV